jgi:L-rhamnose mutarotase
MDRVGFCMRLKPGCADEYRRRHDALWPDLRESLKRAGVADYSIFLAPDGITLFAVLKSADAAARAALPEDPAMRRWWAFMADIMETNPDRSPAVEMLAEVFYLP